MAEETGSSSPRDALFSDEPTRASSPPSSPPGFPWENNTALKDTNATQHKPTVSAFSLLGKRKALEPIDDNARSAKKHATVRAKAMSGDLTQMQISLGQKVQTRCKTCGMEYVPSAAEDRKLHDKYHKQSTQGYDVGKDFVEKTRPHHVFDGAHYGDKICTLNCWDKPARKRRGQEVLQVVQRELGAVDIPEDDIWSNRDRDHVTMSGRPKFDAYLYIRGSRCIGFLLTQLIREAHQVIKPRAVATTKAVVHLDSNGALSALKARQQAEKETQLLQEKLPLELSKESRPAILGISRIWTSPLHRHQSIASKLLDVAVKHHNDQLDRRIVAKRRADDGGATSGDSRGAESRESLDSVTPIIEKVESKRSVAFSQPTEAGTRLARKWFGKPFGWSVYMD